MVRASLAAGLVLSLAACSSEKTVDFDTDEGEGSYSVDVTTGEASGSVTTEEGTVNFRSGADVPVKLPGGFTVYPGAKVVTNTSIDRGGGANGAKGAMLILQSEASPQDMVAFYRKQAEAAGVEIAMEMKTAQGSMIAGQSESGMSFSFNAGEQDGKTNAQLTVGQGLQ